uniref:Uncharacterized protein n=1 Tax=Cucumis melo TaxID=3656 RepID=A0A9I9EIR7_CUCME
MVLVKFEAVLSKTDFDGLCVRGTCGENVQYCEDEMRLERVVGFRTDLILCITLNRRTGFGLGNMLSIVMTINDKRSKIDLFGTARNVPSSQLSTPDVPPPEWIPDNISVIAAKVDRFLLRYRRSEFVSLISLPSFPHGIQLFQIQITALIRFRLFL